MEEYFDTPIVNSQRQAQNLISSRFQREFMSAEPPAEDRSLQRDTARRSRRELSNLCLKPTTQSRVLSVQEGQSSSNHGQQSFPPVYGAISDFLHKIDKGKRSNRQTKNNIDHVQLVIDPDPTSSHFQRPQDRYVRDFASAEREKVSQERQRKQKSYEKKRAIHYERDKTRWEYMDSQMSQNQHRMKSKEEIYKKRSEFNNSVGYNLLNSVYNETDKGNYQRFLDAKNRKLLLDKGTNLAMNQDSTHNPINGADTQWAHLPAAAVKFDLNTKQSAGKPLRSGHSSHVLSIWGDRFMHPPSSRRKQFEQKQTAGQMSEANFKGQIKKSSIKTNIEETYDSMRRERVNGSVPVQDCSQIRTPPSRRLLGPQSVNPIFNSQETAIKIEEGPMQANVLKAPIQLPDLKFKTIEHDQDINDRVDKLTDRNPIVKGHVTIQPQNEVRAPISSRGMDIKTSLGVNRSDFVINGAPLNSNITRNHLKMPVCQSVPNMSPVQNSLQPVSLSPSSIDREIQIKLQREISKNVQSLSQAYMVKLSQNGFGTKFY